MEIGVLPIKFHPPGEDKGYIPVWEPAIATDPFGTVDLGLSNLGVVKELFNPPKYGNPIEKPIK